MFKKFVFAKLLVIFLGSSLFADVSSTREVLSHFSNNHRGVLKSYDRLAYQWECYESSYPGEWDLDKLLQAVEFAAKKHANQKRKDRAATPYIIHPIGVAKLLWEVGAIRSTNVLVAALLHDTLEDTNTSEGEIESLFGVLVLNTVKEVTKDPLLSTDENKQREIDHAPFMSLNAQLVKLADRLYNVRDLEVPPPTWSQEKINQYREWGGKLLRALRGTNIRLENALAALTTERDIQSKEIVGHFRVDMLCYLWTSHGDMFEEYVRLFLENGTSWSYPYIELLDVREGDKVEIVAIAKDDPEYLEGKRYRILGKTEEGHPVQISFTPYPITERENSYYSGFPI